MNYSDRDISLMMKNLKMLKSHYTELMCLCVARSYSSADGREMGTQGFMRRIKIMMHGLEQVFKHLPPEQQRNEVPERDSIVAAEMAVHAFLINVYGAADNLAWVWVHERNVVDPKGRPLKKEQVGLWRSNALVRTSLSASMQAYLRERDDWLDYVAQWRHPLAHRVPPYIPPFSVNPKHAELYKELEEKKAEVLLRGDLATHEEYENEQARLKFFMPLLCGSFRAGSAPILLHPQMISDFMTVHEIASKLIEALDQP